MPSIAFPAISTGVFGYPLAQAASVATSSTSEALAGHERPREARFWLFSDEAFAVFESELDGADARLGRRALSGRGSSARLA